MVIADEEFVLGWQKEILQSDVLTFKGPQFGARVLKILPL